MAPRRQPLMDAPVILVVDDTPTNLYIVSNVLEADVNRRRRPHGP
jgi:CheY-like chemotaxis protein